jgi:tRNA(Leu) C34 or U34 (ribose-2'-O)-methylase TrmL
MKSIELLFDAIRSPTDIANMIQLSLAIDATLYFTGNCVDYNIPKIWGKIRSWGVTEKPNIIHNQSFENMVDELKRQGKTLIGTSPYAKKNFYDLDLKNMEPVFVFGTETSGLSAAKRELLDEMVALPMAPKIRFMILSVCVPPIAYECHRVINRCK